MSFAGFVEWLDVVQLVCTFFHLVGCVYIGHRCFAQRKLSFNALWLPRLLLIFSATLWGFATIFNNPVVFHPDSGLKHTSVTEQGDICLAYHFLNYGIAEPFALFSVALVMRARVASLADYDPLPLGLAVVRRVAYWAGPNFAFHLVVVILNKAASDTPSFVFLAYSKALRICTIPILSLASAGAVFLFFMLGFNVFAHRLSSALINKRLRRRLRSMRLAITVGLLLGNLSRLIILFYEIGAFLQFLPSGDAGALTVDALRQIYYFATISALDSAVWVLVYRPCAEAANFPFFAGKGSIEGALEEDEVISGGAGSSGKNGRRSNVGSSSASSVAGSGSVRVEETTPLKMRLSAEEDITQQQQQPPHQREKHQPQQQQPQQQQQQQQHQYYDDNVAATDVREVQLVDMAAD